MYVSSRSFCESFKEQLGRKGTVRLPHWGRLIIQVSLAELLFDYTAAVAVTTEMEKISF